MASGRLKGRGSPLLVPLLAPLLVLVPVPVLAPDECGVVPLKRSPPLDSMASIVSAP